MAELAKGARQRDHINDMVRTLETFQWDMHSRITAVGYFPPLWREIWETRGRSKTRVTVRIDDDVLRFFRSMGDGYGPRMNGILRSFMLARLGGLIEGEDLAPKYRQSWMGKPRPSFEQAMAEHRAVMGRDADDG